MKNNKILNLKNLFYQILNRKYNAVINAELREEKLSNQWNEAIPYEQIPGPKPIPILGNTWRFIPFIGGYEIEHIDEVSKKLHQQYGDIVRISGLLGRPDMVFLYNPDEIEKVFRKEDTMPHRPAMPSLNYYKHVLRKEFFGNDPGLIAVHGENWHSFRSKVQQLMLQPKIVKMYLKPIEETANTFVNLINDLKDENEEMPKDFLNYIHKWSLESIARVALDVRLGCFDSPPNPNAQKMIDAVNTFFVNVPILELKIPFWRVFNTPTWNDFIQSLDTIMSISMMEINKAFNKPINSQNELSILQRVLEKNNDPKIATVLALDLFLVGIDTTSNAIASILYQLACHQEKQELLYKEIKSVLPKENSELTIEKLEQMNYLRACIRETLRMYPVVVGNGRLTTDNHIIGGYQIPKGVQVIFQHYTMSNNEKYFTNANTFEPERWLKTKCQTRVHHPYASLPFGHGRRMCIGRRFADLEMQIVITKIIQKFKIEYHHEKLNYYIHPMYTPNGPLKLKMLHR